MMYKTAYIYSFEKGAKIWVKHAAKWRHTYICIACNHYTLFYSIYVRGWDKLIIKGLAAYGMGGDMAEEKGCVL